MIRSLKLFAISVASMRSAEKAYQEHPTPRNKSIMEACQNKVDGWLKWFCRQQDAELISKTPPFVCDKSSTNRKVEKISNEQLNVLTANHTKEEIQQFLKSIR